MVLPLPHQGLQPRPQRLEAAPGRGQAEQQVADLLGHFHTIRGLNKVQGWQQGWRFGELIGTWKIDENN